MRPFLVKFHLYADNEEQIQDLQRTLYDFVTSCYQEGIYVSANKLTHALSQFGNNPFIKQFLK